MWDKNAADIIIAISVTIIALSALIVSIWQGVLNRKHNRLSVRPRLRIDLYIHVGCPVTITLKNNGIGPATVRQFSVYLDGTKIDGEYSQPAAEALSRLAIHCRADSYTPGEGDTIAAGETITLLSLQDYPVPDNDKERIALRKDLMRIVFHIRYESMYGEGFHEPDGQ